MIMTIMTIFVREVLKQVSIHSGLRYLSNFRVEKVDSTIVEHSPEWIKVAVSGEAYVHLRLHTFLVISILCC